MSQAVTKDDLDQGLKNLGESLHADINDLARHFTTALGTLGTRVDSQFLEVNTKLDAIMSGEILVTRKQIERLISALEAKGIKLNVSEILAA